MRVIEPEEVGHGVVAFFAAGTFDGSVLVALCALRTITSMLPATPLDQRSRSDGMLPSQAWSASGRIRSNMKIAALSGRSNCGFFVTVAATSWCETSWLR